MVALRPDPSVPTANPLFGPSLVFVDAFVPRARQFVPPPHGVAILARSADTWRLGIQIRVQRSPRRRHPRNVGSNSDRAPWIEFRYRVRKRGVVRRGKRRGVSRPWCPRTRLAERERLKPMRKRAVPDVVSVHKQSCSRTLTRSIATPTAMKYWTGKEPTQGMNAQVQHLWLLGGLFLLGTIHCFSFYLCNGCGGRECDAWCE